MGIFTNKEEAKPETVYNDLKEFLSEKDGLTHIVMVNTFSKWTHKKVECDSNYTNQVDAILTLMQKDGYEIIDIKFNSLINQGYGIDTEGFRTLITYK